MGWAESKRGAKQTLVTFLVAHVGVLILVLLCVVLPMELAGKELGTVLAATRDVGGSAGSCGCLGLGVDCLRGRTRRGAPVGVALFLGDRLLISLGLEAEHTTIRGDLAHPTAFLMGPAIARLWPRAEKPASS